MIIMNKQKNRVVLMVVLLSLFFLILAIGYSQSYSPGVFPDEFAHMGYVVDVIKHHFPDYNNGLIYSSSKFNYLNHPALYYIIVGELASVLHLQDAFVSVGRYVNMLVSVIIIALTCKMLYLTTRSILATFVGGAFLLVIPMFVVLGSAVNNDQINILGCTLVIYGLHGLMAADRESKTITSNIFLICLGGVIASLSKATGSLAIICLLTSVIIFNFSSVILLIKNIALKQFVFIMVALAIVVFYFAWVYVVYGKFYPAPQSNPAIWFFIEHPNAERMALTDFSDYFFHNNLLSLLLPYGHVQFADSGIRSVILKIILIMTGCMAGYIVLKKLFNNNGLYNLEFSFVMAFALFLILYFLTIRQLHLNTGYVGATQARYFFGFLPVVSLVIAKCTSCLHKKIIKAAVVVLMMAGLVASIYPALVKFSAVQVWKSQLIIEQPLFDTNYGFLTKGHYFEQMILAEAKSINGVELMLATFARKNQGNLTLELIDSSGKIIASNTVKMESLADNSYAWFDLHHSDLIKNQKYRLRLTCDECTPDNAITWWAFKQEYESSVFLFNSFGPATRKIYSHGEAYVDGANVGGAYSFRLYF